MKINIFQYDVKWMDINENLDRIADHLQNLEQPIDLLILPEMFLTGFNMDAEASSISENHSGVLELISLCKKYKTHILGSLAIAENNQFYNRVLLLSSKGIMDRYDKQYLYTPSGENETFSSKYQTKIFDILGWKIIPQVCYDLRFPENIRQLPAPDLLIYSANWPAPRIRHWETLLQARAIENQCYTIGCNRLGIDNNGWEFPGKSLLVKPDGGLVDLSDNQDALVLELDLDVVKRYRGKYKFQEDRKF